MLKTKFWSAFFVLIFCCAFLLAFVGCGEQNSQEDQVRWKSVSVFLDSSHTTSGTESEVTANYNDSLFLKDAKVFDKNMALLSFAMAASGQNDSCQTKTKSTKFFEDVGFSNIFVSGYDQETTKDTVAFAIASKQFEDLKSHKTFNVVGIALRGFGYCFEWQNNVTVGETGNHQGFDSAATKVFNALKSYVVSNNLQNTKIWLGGYSRGGAIANVLALKILEDESFAIKKSNLFAYTFEAPRGVDAQNTLACENVFNIIVSLDPVTNVSPSAYGLKRCGTDVDVFVEDVLEVIQSQGAQSVLKPFVPTEHISSQKALLNRMLALVLKDEIQYSGTNFVDISTRQKYCENMQSCAQYITSVFFSINSTTLNQIFDELSNLSKFEKALLLVGDNLYEFMSSILANDPAEIDQTKLKECCELFRVFGASNISDMLKLLDVGVEGILSLLDYHYPDVVFVLLKNHLENF